MDKGGCNNSTIPDGITTIGDQAFCDTGIKNITIPNSVTNIEKWAFNGCDSLSSIVIPNSVTELGYYAFAFCDNLKSISFSNKITTIKDGTCDYCYNLQDIIIPNSVTTIKNCSFEYCKNVQNIYIPQSVIEISTGCFSGTNAKSIIVESNNPKYDSRNDCNAIIETKTDELVLGSEYTKIPETVTYIKEYAFSGSKVKSISIPSAVLGIGMRAFRECKELEKVVLSSNMTYLDYGVFEKCDSVKEFYCYAAKVPTAGTLSLPIKATLYVPSKSIDLYKTADEWKDFSSILPIEESSISSCISTKDRETTIYDLSGRKLFNKRKGFNIINGKKVLIR